VDVHREMRAVKPTDSNMDDARLKTCAVVRRNWNPALCDLGETALTEADGR
jgi:hypothetical protein